MYGAGFLITSSCHSLLFYYERVSVLQGPGDYCGGPSDVRGKCGEGMHCACGKCNGCSLATLDCYFGLDQLQCL
jgi:hypothetical protein